MKPILVNKWNIERNFRQQQNLINLVAMPNFTKHTENDENDTRFYKQKNDV